MQDVVQPIARNLRRLRTEQNLSISGLADRAGVSKSTLSNLERGIGNPSIDTLWAVARVLGVPFATLFEEDDPTAVDVLRFEDAPEVPGPRAAPGTAARGPATRSATSRAGAGAARSRPTSSISRREVAGRPDRTRAAWSST